MNNQQFLSWLEQFTQSPHKSQKPLIMGILNVTPDSFSDGGLYLPVEKAVVQAKSMIEAGADLIDIGGESSQPGAESVSIQEEINRVVPVIHRLRQETSVCIAIDTCKSQVMRAAVEAGATLINDISALRDEDSMTTAAELNVPVILMHMLGRPKTMQKSIHYNQDVVNEINVFFNERIEQCLAAGLSRHQLILDPGFGFGKTVEHNLWLTKNLDKFQQHGLPVLLGASRKSTLGAVLNQEVEKRLISSLSVAIYAFLQGVDIVRVHDVDETNQAFRMIEAILNSQQNKN